ncbi:MULTISPECIES: hypothetical protein [Micromonospora]|uniref:hypothetical protein n=1 Tax=Micromonospora TaxID=1873 RepID=UPI001EE95D5F|nr:MULTISPECIES: hypothetical protein [Micromonospora]MCG5448551.1 hypothetical protein [Micromonospora hortensis]MCX5119371.1 hypothetical protein [Micromonospora sp. NBC_00362]WTI08584.1 hypothetical protein OHB44_02540 [Micromonospora sp. NBC_00821]
MSQNLALIGVTVAVLAVLGLHLLMARRGPAWMGAVVPCLFVIAAVVLIVQGRIPAGKPYVVVVAGLVTLLWIWAGARQARSKAAASEPSGSVRRES